MRSWTLGLAAAAALAATATDAATTSYGLGAGVGQSDNIARTSTNEQSETQASAGLDFSIAETGGRLRGTAAADLAFIDYLDDTFDSEVLGNFNGLGSFDLIPERL